jgi:hypothetical protein
MRPRQAVHLFTFAASTIWLTACGGGGGSTPPTPPPAISVAFSATPPTSLATSATLGLTALVTNDSANAGVKWSVTCSATACGGFSAASTPSGTATTYTAPATPPTNPATVTVTATSVTDSTKSASAIITITVVSPAISVTLSPTPPTSLVAGTTASITAVVTNDSKNAGVTWSVTCGVSACGGFSPASTASGTATTYTAPTTPPPSPGTVNVTATSVTDTTKTASATITITNTPPPVLANGTYVYHVSGEDSTGPYFVVGAFTVQGGAITAGEQDFSNFSIGYTNNLVASGSALTTVGNNIQIAINTGNTSIGVSGIETFRGTHVSSTRVLISEFDTFAAASGSIDLQTGTAAPSGGYAFNVGGADGSPSGAALALGGILNISGTTISTTNSIFDFNDNGTVEQGLFFSSGSAVTAPDSFGRLTFTLNLPANTLPGIVLTGYIVGTNRIQLVESQADPLGGDVGGTALGQGSNTGNFSAANSGNTTYVFTGNGVDSAGVLHIGADFVLNSNGTVSGNIALNDLSSYGSVTITGGTYTVDPTGRVTLVNVTPTLVNGIDFGFQLYLDGNGNALEIGVDASELNAGLAYKQTAASTTFAGSYALSGFGFGNLNGKFPPWSAVGPVTVASNSFTGSTDYNLLGGAQTSSVSLTGTETSSTQALALIGLNAASTQTSNNYIYFPIDATRVIALEADGQQLGLLQIEEVGP